MSESVTAYPLCWPVGWQRTPQQDRAEARFSKGRRNRSGYYSGYARGASMTAARRSFFEEIDRLGATDVVLSTNIELRRDGLPCANRRTPTDTGVAVYFNLDGAQQCIPCDRWNRVADNLYAIAKTIEALRGIDRWGAKDMVSAAFTGFQALPEVGGTGGSASWWVELGIDALERDPEAIRAAYKTRARATHPDTGGSDEEFHRVQEAFRMALDVCREAA